VGDDPPTGIRYERQSLEALGITIDLATSTDCAVELAVEGRYRLSISDMNRTSSSAATCSAVGSGFFFVTVSSVSVITAPFQLNTRPSNQGRKHLQLQRPERQPSTLVKDLGQAVVLR
jgi:hypothetical protein